MRCSIGSLAIGGVLLAAVPVAGEERPPAVYLQAGPLAVHQEGPAGEMNGIYKICPGGTALGWQAVAGIGITQRWSIELQFESGGMWRAREHERYGYTYNEELRTRALGPTIRFHALTRRHIGLEPLAGLCLLWHQSWSQDEHDPLAGWPGAHVIVDERRANDTVWRMGISAGLDVRLGTRRLAFVPSIRVRTALSGRDSLTQYVYGIPSWNLTAGLNARFGF